MVAGSSAAAESPGTSYASTGQSSPTTAASAATRRPTLPITDVMLVRDRPPAPPFGGLMDRASYDDFAARLTASLEARPGVLGLVAAGSFASGPDEWSDHDFLVVAEPAVTESLRTDPTWLPDHERLVLHYRE